MPVLLLNPRVMLQYLMENIAHIEQLFIQELKKTSRKTVMQVCCIFQT